MTSKCKNMLANEKRQEHQKWHIPRNGLAVSSVQTDSEKLHLNITLEYKVIFQCNKL